MAFTSNHLAHQGTAKVVDNVVGELAAFVEAFVDDGAFLAHLRKEIAVEAGVASAGGVGHVDVRDAASGGLMDAAAIALDPGEMVAFVEAFVDDGAFLAHLRKEIAVEAGVASAGERFNEG